MATRGPPSTVQMRRPFLQWSALPHCQATGFICRRVSTSCHVPHRHHASPPKMQSHLERADDASSSPRSPLQPPQSLASSSVRMACPILHSAPLAPCLRLCLDFVAASFCKFLSLQYSVLFDSLTASLESTAPSNWELLCPCHGERARLPGSSLAGSDAVVDERIPNSCGFSHRGLRGLALVLPPGATEHSWTQGMALDWMRNGAHVELAPTARLVLSAFLGYHQNLLHRLCVSSRCGVHGGSCECGVHSQDQFLQLPQSESHYASYSQVCAS